MKRSGTDWLSRSLYVSPIYYGLCLTEEAFHRELKRQDVSRDEWPSFMATPQADATAHHFTRDSADYMVIVCLRNPRGKTREEVYGLLIHEAVHIWQSMREYMGETNPGREQEAYAVQTIAQELICSYRDQRKRKLPRS